MAGKIGVCKLCGETKKLCKAHVIPEAFYGSLIGENKKLMAFSGDGSKRPPRRPIGAYDPGILCAECDNSLEDDYAFELLKDPAATFVKVDEPKSSFYERRDYDYERLMKFFIALIWRASICETHDVSNQALGDYYSQRARSILKQESDDFSEFSVAVALICEGLQDTFIHFPVRVSKKSGKGINMWYCRTARYNFFIKVDKRDWPLKNFRDFCIRKSEPFRILIMTQDGSVPGAQKMINNNEKWNVFD